MVRAVVALTFAAFLASCIPQPPAAAPTSVLRIAQSAEPGSLDPLLLTGYPAEEIGSLIYSFLVRIDERGILVPDLARRVPSLENGDIARDGRTIVYHLRRGVRWHDGQRFSAADVIATYRAVMDARNPVPTRLGFDRIVSLDAPDPFTLRIRLRTPFAPFLTYFFETENYPILPAHVLAHEPILVGASLDATPIGTGPYRLERWKRGESLVLRANSDYFAGAPRVDRLDLRFITSMQTIVQQLRTGEIDAIFAADPAYIERLRENTALTVITAPIYGFESLTFQTADPAVRDVGVRRALAGIFNFPQATERAAHGALPTRDAGRGLFTWAYRSQSSAPPVAVPLPRTLRLAIDASRPSDRAIAVALQADAREAGVDLAIVPYAPQLFYARASEHGPLNAGRFQLALHQLLTGADPETAWLLACDQRPPAGFNIARYCNPEVDRALREAVGTFDRRQRQGHYDRIQAALSRDVPFVAVWQTHEVEALPRGLRGFRPNPETPFASVAAWRFEKAR